MQERGPVELISAIRSWIYQEFSHDQVAESHRAAAEKAAINSYRSGASLEDAIATGKNALRDALAGERHREA